MILKLVLLMMHRKVELKTKMPLCVFPDFCEKEGLCAVSSVAEMLVGETERQQLDHPSDTKMASGMFLTFSLC